MLKPACQKAATTLKQPAPRLVDQIGSPGLYLAHPGLSGHPRFAQKFMPGPSDGPGMFRFNQFHGERRIGVKILRVVPVVAGGPKLY